MTRQQRRAPNPFLAGVDGPEVRVPARVAAWLSHNIDLVHLRSRARGEGPEIAAVLGAIEQAAVISGAASPQQAQHDRPNTPPDLAPSDLVTVVVGAEWLGVGEEAVRAAIRRGRLPATRDDRGRHQITGADLRRYDAQRRDA